MKVLKSGEDQNMIGKSLAGNTGKPRHNRSNTSGNPPVMDRFLVPVWEWKAKLCNSLISVIRGYNFVCEWSYSLFWQDNKDQYDFYLQKMLHTHRYK